MNLRSGGVAQQDTNQGSLTNRTTEGCSMLKQITWLGIFMERKSLLFHVKASFDPPIYLAKKQH
ncbi:MAG: hypothetical protein B6242_14855 [Anaerolineaceae bacterium 4572_78]|nr:MAG: hypothetical protein B6242_14855 [Anaerolineaceae bacterium 4572_78]